LFVLFNIPKVPIFFNFSVSKYHLNLISEQEWAVVWVEEWAAVWVEEWAVECQWAVVWAAVCLWAVEKEAWAEE
jgi:hypothetical protein